MPGRHHLLSLSFVSRNRIGVGLALVLVLLAGLGLWAASTGQDSRRPLMIMPPPSVLAGVEPAASPAISLRPAPTSASAVPSKVRSRPTTKAPSRPAKTKAAPPRVPAFSARYAIANSRQTTFQVGVFLKNTSSSARNWQVSVTHAAAAGVRVRAAYGATMTTSGNTVVFSGGPLKAGGSTFFGFQAGKTARGVVRPTACRVDGKDCVVTVQRYRNERRARTR
jgi:cellulose binding protein with CBM2 domain